MMVNTSSIIPSLWHATQIRDQRWGTEGSEGDSTSTATDTQSVRVSQLGKPLAIGTQNVRVSQRSTVP